MSFLYHVYELLRYPDRWHVDYVEVEFSDGGTLEFEDPDYWGAFDYEYIVLPKDQGRQIRIERDCVRSVDVVLDFMEEDSP